MLSGLVARNVRIIQASSIDLGPGFNLLVGQNAAGKTSWLEAIHILCRAKPMSGKHAGALIRSGEAELDVRGRWQEDGRDVSLQVRASKSETHPVAGVLASRQEYAHTAGRIPIQVLGPTSHVIVDGGPESRRRWLDWGVFHVEHAYLEPWRNFNRVLKQRNVCLQQGRPEREIRAWERQLAALAEQVEAHRARYWGRYQAILEQAVHEAVGFGSVSFEYQRGWPEQTGLGDLLEENRPQDQERGFTWYGPQRAEVNIRINGRPVRDVCSRGQKKLLAYLMLLTQSGHASEQSGRKPLLLVDDLASELDAGNAAIVLDWLRRLGGQSIITAIQPDSLRLDNGPGLKMFHVEQGRIRRTYP